MRNLPYLEWAKSTNEMRWGLQLINTFLSASTIAHSRNFSPPPALPQKIECVNYWFLSLRVEQSPSDNTLIRQKKQQLRFTHIAGWGQILLSSWHSWLAAGPWPHWLLPSTNQGWSCPGCWSADPWRSSAHPDWQQRSRTLRWLGTLRDQGHKGFVIKGPEIL